MNILRIYIEQSIWWPHNFEKEIPGHQKSKYQDLRTILLKLFNFQGQQPNSKTFKILNQYNCPATMNNEHITLQQKDNSTKKLFRV